jgi:hypothetical protein
VRSQSKFAEQIFKNKTRTSHDPNLASINTIIIASSGLAERFGFTEAAILETQFFLDISVTIYLRHVMREPSVHHKELCVVRLKSIDVSDRHAASFFMVDEKTKKKESMK